MKRGAFKRFCTTIGGIALAFSLVSTHGQEAASPAETARALTGTNSIPLGKVPSVVLKELGNEDVFDQITSPLLTRIFQSKDGENAFRQFINDWHIRPKAFQTTGASSNNVTFGIEFDFKKSLANHVLNEDSKNPIGLALSVEAKGDVALEANKNPNNLIEAGGSFHLFQGLGGIDPEYDPTTEAQKKLQDTIKAAAKGDKTAYRQAASEFTAHMRPQLFYDLQASGAYETDQQFRNQQWAYGGKVAFVFRDWRAQSEIGWFNVLDYPFAGLRSLINHEDFRPSGRTFPSVLAGVDLVDPSENDARLAIDPDRDIYPRLRVEIAFKTPFMRLGSDHLYFSAAYRHFQELGASTLIKAAKLDHSDYFVAKLDLPFKFNISYSTGKLPLDQRNDQVVAVGWTLNF